VEILAHKTGDEKRSQNLIQNTGQQGHKMNKTTFIYEYVLKKQNLSQLAREDPGVPYP
jgi:hypothetical protein